MVLTAGLFKRLRCFRTSSFWREADSILAAQHRETSPRTHKMATRASMVLHLLNLAEPISKNPLKLTNPQQFPLPRRQWRQTQKNKKKLAQEQQWRTATKKEERCKPTRAQLSKKQWISLSQNCPTFLSFSLRFGLCCTNHFVFKFRNGELMI